MRWLIAALALLVLAACGGAPILRLSALPDGLGSNSVATHWPNYPGMPQMTDRVAFYEIYKGSEFNAVGHMIIAQYNDPYWRDKAYQAVLAQMQVKNQADPVAGLVDQGMSTGPNDTWRNSNVLFVRCNTVVHVSMPVAESVLIEYAPQLGQDVEKVFCS